MAWSTIVVFWTVLGCFFSPIYFTALICSIIKICRDRRRIIEKNKSIRESRISGNGIEAQGSVKRPNIEIIHDEERAKQFRPKLSRETSSIRRPAKGPKTVDSEDLSWNNHKKSHDNNVGRLANGHTTHVTIEHCLTGNAPAPDHHPPTKVQGQGQSIIVSSPPDRSEESAYEAFDAVEGADSECSDSLARTTPSDTGSCLANTDTEIICEGDPSSDPYQNLSFDRSRHGGKGEASSEDSYLHPHQTSRKEKKRQPDAGSRLHQHQHKHQQHSGSNRRRSRSGENENTLDGHRRDKKSKSRTDNSMATEEEFLGQYYVRNRRISSGVIQDHEEKSRKDNEYSMAMLRSKSEDNIRPDAADANLLIYEQGRENHAFERSTENTRM